MRKGGLLCLACLFLAADAGANGATSRDQAIDAGLKVAKASLSAMGNSRARPVIQTALNAVVAHAVAALRDEGFNQEADQAEREWNTRFSNAMNEIEGLYLGEHSPLSQWLADFYRQVQGKIGTTACRVLGLDDIFVFNYGIPVVLHPRGTHGEKWNSQEYALHFVPVTGAITYWVAQSACTATVQGIASFFCGGAASVVRAVVERTIAPPLSDYVYSVANGLSADKPEYDFDNLTQDAHHVLDGY